MFEDDKMCVFVNGVRTIWHLFLAVAESLSLTKKVYFFTNPFSIMLTL